MKNIAPLIRNPRCDPTYHFFKGRKLIDKVEEEILAVIKNPKEAIFKPEQEE